MMSAARAERSAAVPPEQSDILQRLQRLRRLAHWMDGRFRVPVIGVRFGLDSILGLVPGVGDTATAIISLATLHEARKLGGSRWLLARMTANVLIDAGVGSIPLLGDLFDVYWKANEKNLELLEREIARQGLTSPDTNRRSAEASPGGSES